MGRLTAGQVRRGSLSSLACSSAAILVLASCSPQQITPSTASPTTEAATSASSPVPTHALSPAQFELRTLSITPKTVTANESVTVGVIIANTGEVQGTYDAVLKVDGVEAKTQQVALPGGTSQNVTFNTVFSNPGTYVLNIGPLADYIIVDPHPRPLPPVDAFMKGIWFNDQPWALDKPRPSYGAMYSLADPQLKRLATTGANWISVVFHVFQETAASTNVTRNQFGTPSDEALRHVIELAHSLGIRVALVPYIDLTNDPTHSWIHIGTAFTSETEWQKWFSSYGDQIDHFASLAQEAGADLFYIGSELPGTTHREDDWRQIVKRARERFKGPISYDSIFWGSTMFQGNPAPEYKRIRWWDDLDYIAVDFWYSLTTQNNPTVDELKQGWMNTGYLASAETISRQFNKPFILSEIGYDSLDGTAKNYPVTHRTVTAVDLQEQADCYQAALEVLWGKPWLKGIFWWQWNAITTRWPEDPNSKPAEEILKRFYLSN